MELDARQESSSGPGALRGEEPLMPGWGAGTGQSGCSPSALWQAGPSADLGASDICTVFCADFHAHVTSRK